jgi:transposase-like protein
VPDPFRPQPAHSGAQVRSGSGGDPGRSIFAQPDGDSVWAQHGRIVAQLQERFPEAARLLVETGPDLLAFTSFPKEHWRQIWSNNPQERLNREIRRRTDVVGIFPNRVAVLRLVGAVLAEQHDEWAIARRYMTAESLAKTRVTVIDENAKEEPKQLAKAG